MRLKKILFGVAAAVLAGTIIAACGGGGGNDSFDVMQGVVIQNASIVNTRDGSILFAKSIVLDGGKIQKISASTANIGGSAQAIDASGKFLIPGLMDMHTHYFDNPTDQPQTAALLVANGHQEYKMLAAGGLSPLDILQMTTLNGAQFMNRETTMGTVDEGKNADLVLLDANPVTDVANLDKISAVLLRGKYLSKTALDKMKSDVAAFYASQSTQQSAQALSAAHMPAHDD